MQPAQTARSRAPSRLPATSCDRIVAAVEEASGNSFCVQVVVRLDGQLDERLLARAVRLTLDLQPYLGCRFVRRWIKPYWKRFTDLDSVPFFEMHEADSAPDPLERVLSQQMDPARDCAVKVILLRDEADILCIKLDHKMGDGQAAKQYTYLLAETYSKLVEDPQYVGSPQPPGDRSFAQVTQGMSRAERAEMLQIPTSARKGAREVRNWFLPQPKASQDAPAASEFLIERISAERHANIFRYACAHKATVNQVMLAAFARAAVATIPRAASGTSQVIQTVDLRRYLPGKQTSMPCNLAGMIGVSVRCGVDDPLDCYVAEIRDEMFEMRKEPMGIPRRMMRWDTTPRGRLFFGCVASGLLTRAVRRYVSRRGPDGFPSRLVLSDVGSISAGSLTFAGVGAADAFVVSGTVMLSGSLLLSISEFSGTLTISVGFSPRLISEEGVRSFVRTMVENLPR